MNSFCRFALWVALIVSAYATPSQVIVIRHGEKPKDHDAKHLSAAGRERAERLVEFVKHSPELTKFGMPQVLIAAHPRKEGGGQRTSETLEPLAKELKLPIQTPFQSDHSEKLAANILSAKEYDGKTVLVCWTHEHIPELIEALGVHPAPEKLSEDAYDRVYVVHYDRHPPSLRMLRQDMPSAPEGKETKPPHFGKKLFKH